MLIALAGSVPARAEAQAEVRIALVSDTHTTRSTQGEKPGYRVHLDQVIQQVNNARVDFVLVAGDLTDGGLAEQVEDFHTQIQAFHEPVLYVPGNHDIGDKHIPGKPGGVTKARLARYESALGPSFYATTLCGIHLVLVNTPLLGSGLDREGDEWSFLERELDHPGRLPILLLMHYPAFLAAPDEPGGSYWNLEPAPRARLLELVKRGGVKAVLSGHLHRPLHLELEGVLYVGTPPVSFGIPAGKQPEGWTLVTMKPDGSIQSKFHPVTH